MRVPLWYESEHQAVRGGKKGVPHRKKGVGLAVWEKGSSGMFFT